MHDIRLIRADPEAFDAEMKRRGSYSSDAILHIDGIMRGHLREREALLAEHKARSREYGDFRRSQASVPNSLILDIERISARLEYIDLDPNQNPDELLRQRDALIAALPNVADVSVPVGSDETANVQLKIWGHKREFNFEAKNHAEIGPPLGLDFETGAAISGARFTFLRGQVARLQRALGQFMLDRQGSAGFTECAPPLLVRDEAMFGTAQLPKFAEDSFWTYLKPDFADYFRDRRESALMRGFFGDGEEATEIIESALREMFERLPPPQERRWLIPTSEVSLTNSIREQILADSQLPIKMTALTPCFRSEAGSAGKDTRGYIRQHQFEKVELVTICRPEDSAAEHENMTLAAEAILEALDLPYRRMLLCAGDMGFSARKTYDLEVWLPGQDAYREISSISDCGDFQARRMNARYRPDGQKGTQFVHTLNGSGLAVGRTLVAVLENYQQEDGSVDVPQALLPYMGGVTRLTPAQ